MGNLHLVTGYAGQEHVTAVDHGAFNAALIGTGQFVLEKGKVFEAQVISNNQIRVFDGELMMQGRFVRLNPGTYVDLTIENGTQGMKRNDLIAARYTKNTGTGVEEVNLVVIKGTAAGSNPADPKYTEGDVASGEAVLNDFPLWRIPINGLNVGTPEMLFEPFFDSMRTLPGIREQVNQLDKKVDQYYERKEVFDDESKALFGLGSAAVPNDAFKFLGKHNQHWWSVLHSQAGTGFEEERTEITNDDVPYIWVVGEYETSRAISYAKEIKVNQADGTITLVNPKSLTINIATEADMAASIAAITALFPVYITGLYSNPDSIYYLPSASTVSDATDWYDTDATIRAYWEYNSDDGYTRHFYLNVEDRVPENKRSCLVTSRVYNIAQGATTYVQSLERNAYPDYAVTDGKVYRYLGIPFDNAVPAASVNVREYTGTGSTEKPVSLTFDRLPQFVLIASVNTDYGQREATAGTAMLFPAQGYSISFEGGNYAYFVPYALEVEGLTIKIANVMNTEGQKYIATAFI